MTQGVDEAIARFDELVERYGGATPAGRANRRQLGRSAASAGKRVANIGIALAALIVVTIGIGLVGGPIGISGLFWVVVAALALIVGFSLLPTEKPLKAFTEQMTNSQVVRRLDSYLSRQRRALPAPAARRVDAISQQLPLLESRLGELDALDPLAQEARRLMGKHLPDLVDHYERVPAEYRNERDSGGLTADERLVTALDAAKEAIDGIRDRLTQNDRTALETQGRFIESRYKGAGPEGG